ncbi:hypothetical protein SUNI508_08172 [Seiridium unicorne]|uniref:Uncharacterized protein n=1 Tax=Seiridium unicorne TaxID=138068 RepID=A0ABR2UUU2_9PEZI
MYTSSPVLAHIREILRNTGDLSTRDNHTFDWVNHAWVFLFLGIVCGPMVIGVMSNEGPQNIQRHVERNLLLLLLLSNCSLTFAWDFWMANNSAVAEAWLTTSLTAVRTNTFAAAAWYITHFSSMRPAKSHSHGPGECQGCGIKMTETPPPEHDPDHTDSANHCHTSRPNPVAQQGAQTALDPTATQPTNEQEGIDQPKPKSPADLERQSEVSSGD